MPEPLKNLVNTSLLRSAGADLKAVYPAFDQDKWEKLVFEDPAFPNLELKQRFRLVAATLRPVLPPDLKEALDVVQKTVQHMIDREGEKLTYLYGFLNDFVEIYAIDEPELAIPVFETVTRWCSAEFAVRPFILRYPERMFRQMMLWSEHPSPMVRRLSSEGFRPRLPWGLGIPALKKDPSVLLPMLEKLKNDPAETVRRSVANNLNDIAKDHPDIVLDIARRWKGISPETDWIVRHASRGLLKKGNASALAHFGFEHGIEGVTVSDLTCDASVHIGDRFSFSFVIHNESTETKTVRLEYTIVYQTKSGKPSRKTFKIKEGKMAPGARETVSRTQRFEDFTTRKHYPGEHKIEIVLNGKTSDSAVFHVV
ncbi:MAG: hypothetical protein IT270_08275 [Saprospiraceae bacterium]|nr:hypothetical protein [Saprospiraceae bacterium]